MTIRESYVCPRCGKAGSITSIQTLMDDVRFDSIKCTECGVEWRAYYRTSDVVTEVTFIPPEVTETEKGEPSEEEHKAAKSNAAKKVAAKAE